MSAERAVDQVPTAPLIAIGLMLGLILISIAASRLSGVPPVARERVPVAESRDIRIEERGDGGVRVFDAASRSMVADIPPRTHGFVGVVHRGVVYERTTKQADIMAPVRLNKHIDGTLSIDDPETGRHIILTAFGGENAASFEQLLASRDRSR